MLRRRKNRAQTTAEYLLVISVLVIGIVAVLYSDTFKGPVKQGSDQMKNNLEKATKQGGIGNEAQSAWR